MKVTNKELFREALIYFTLNVDEILDDIIENDDWSKVVLKQQFKDWEINDIHSEEELVNMTIQEIQETYNYKYPYVDFKGGNEIHGYMYSVVKTQYFIDNKETYFKLIDNE